jgi:hypothetical protein
LGLQFSEIEYPSTMNPAAVDLMKQLLRKDPAERISLADVKVRCCGGGAVV